MKEYREAIMLDSAMTKLLPPSKNTHAAFRTRFFNLESGLPDPALKGSDSTIYDSREGLVSLGQLAEEDRLTTLLRKHARLLFLTQQSSATSRVVEIDCRRISLVVTLINVFLTAGSPFGAIYNLYYVHHDQIKLGLIACYITAFAACIALLANAKGAEIFGACAAYTAVLVVFVSGDLASSADDT